MATNEIVCTCAEISNYQIISAIIKGRLKTINEVCEITGAGLICGGCRPVIQEILLNNQQK